MYFIYLSNGDTSKLEKHVPVSCGFLVVPEHGISLDISYYEFKGLDCILQMMKKLEQVAFQLTSWIDENSRKPISDIPNIHYNQVICYLCKESIMSPSERVADHDHRTGKYLGAAHSKCNIRRREQRSVIPVIFHNLAYDLHHLVKNSMSSLKNWQLKVIAKTTEEYMSLTAYIKDSDSKSAVTLRFVDSFRFLPNSLANLVKGCTDFRLTKTLGIDSKFQKGIFPYSYIRDITVLDDTQLPKYEDFYNTLEKKVTISREEYETAKEAWSQFKCSNLWEYMLLYMKLDIYLLADVFSEFRQLVMREDSLDPVWFVSLPGLSWSSSLKYIRKEIVLLHDEEIYEFFEKSIRGGITFINSHYEKRDDNNELMYIDANNLYGFALSQKLPVCDFQWMFGSDALLAFNNLDNEHGMFLEVDLSTPEWLQDLTDDFPFAVQQQCPKSDWLTPYMKDEWQKLNPNKMFRSTEKLLLTHFPKEKYIIHDELLSFFLSKGMVLEKVHKAVHFKKDYIFRDYIEYNSKRRSECKDEMGKSYYKLKNNALYGKSVENLRKRKDVRLVNNRDKLLTYTSKPTFESINVFGEDLAAILLMKETVVLDRPSYIGAAVLEISKLHMYQLRYEKLQAYMDEFPGSKISVVAMDTDSFFLKLNNLSIERQLWPAMIRDELLDTSNFIDEHPLKSNKRKAKLGCVKDEGCGKTFDEWIFLRPKCYSLKMLDSSTKCTAKGVQK